MLKGYGISFSSLTASKHTHLTASNRNQLSASSDYAIFDYQNSLPSLTSTWYELVPLDTRFLEIIQTCGAGLAPGLGDSKLVY